MAKIMSVDVMFDGHRMRAVPKVYPAWRMLSDQQVALVPGPFVHMSHVSDVEPFQMEMYLFQCIRVLVAAWELAQVTAREPQPTLWTEEVTADAR
jgi:hypothetical protein